MARRLDEPGDFDRIVDRRAALDELVAADAHTEGEFRCRSRRVRPRRSRSSAVPGSPTNRRTHRCAGWWPATGSHGRSTSGCTATRCRRSRPRHSARRPARSRRRSLRSRRDDTALGTSRNSGIGDGRRGPHRQARVHRAGLSAVVVDLGEDRHVMAMHRIGHLPVAGDHVAMEAVDQLLVRPIGGMCRVLLGDDQAGATRGARRVVRGVLLGRLAVAGVVGEVRAEDDSVACRDRTDRQRSPEVAIGHRWVRLPMLGSTVSCATSYSASKKYPRTGVMRWLRPPSQRSPRPNQRSAR